MEDAPMRFRLLTLAAVVSLFNFTSAAQTSTTPPAARQQPAVNPPPDPPTQVPAPKPEDVKSTDSILSAVYSVISGPAGDRDWNRFRSLFLPGATLTSAGKDREGNIHVRPHSVEQYVTGAGGYFAQHGFFESPIVSRVPTFGNIAHILCSYESPNAPGEAPFDPGRNTFELAYDGKRGGMVSIVWNEERPDNPLPKEFAANP